MYTVHTGKMTRFNILNTYINADTQYMYYTQYVTKAQYIEILIGLKDGSSTSRLLICNSRLLILRQGFKDLYLSISLAFKMH